MRRFVYAPDVSAYVSLQDGTVLDLTEDIISGSITRRVNAVSDASLTLQNNNKKYLDVMHPMDRIAIYLTRIHKPVLSFSGYLNRVPWEQPFPGPVQITASCTLKRLLYTYWDPGLPFVYQYLAQFGWYYNFQTGMMQDPTHGLFNMDINGGLGNLLRAIMHDVGGWPIGYKSDNGRNTVHVQKLPKQFLSVTKKLFAEQAQMDIQNQAVIDRVVESLFTANGVYVGSGGTSPDSLNMTDNVEDTNPLGKAASNKEYLATIFGEAFAGNSPTTAATIDTYLASKSSPLGGLGQTFVTAANRNNFDARLLVAISGAETSFGTNMGSNAPNNVFSWAVGTSFASYTAAINTVADGLGSGYISQGLTTITDIGGKYAPLSVSGNETWVPNVTQFYTELGGSSNGSVLIAETSADAKTYKPTGTLGDVKVSDPAFFTNSILTTSNVFDPTTAVSDETNLTKANGATFRIKGNPYGDDTYMFHAVYDKSIPFGQISIYVPGAANKGTPWAQDWKNHKVTLETSFGKDPFSSSGATNPDKKSNTTGVYVNPFLKSMENIVPERTDQGVDYNWNSSTPQEILAIGNGTVIGITPHWYLNQPFMWYQLADGDHAGQYVYVSECIDLLVGKGDQITAGQTIARWNPAVGGNGIEIGFAQQDGQVLTPATGHDHNNTAGGLQFARFLKSLGAPVRDDPGTGTGSSSTTGGSAYTGIGDTGVQAAQSSIASIAASSSFGIQLGFPAVADYTLSIALTGERSLANAVPLFEWIQFICTASGRSFTSMPNGDFLAFYPDYFNWSGESPYFVIDPIETIELTVDVGDDELTTHVFTTGDTNFSNTIDLMDRLASSVASVQDVTAFTELVNTGNDTFDPVTFLQRYGPRPLTDDRPEIKNSLLQYMYAWNTFLQKWAKQFYCSAEFTFMPELQPGGLVKFNGFDLQFYIEEVTHDFDRSSGFSTSASLIAPSTINGKGRNPAMVLAGPPG